MSKYFRSSLIVTINFQCSKTSRHGSDASEYKKDQVPLLQKRSVPIAIGNPSKETSKGWTSIDPRIESGKTCLGSREFL